MNLDNEKSRDLESELRQTAGREWAEEAAEDEQLTELQRRRNMSLTDRARELIASGQRVRVEAGTQTFSGAIAFAGSDYAVVERSDDLVAILFDGAIWTVEPGEGVSHEQPAGGSLTMKAYLGEVASTSETVRLVVGDGRAVVGSVALVATDHVDIDQDGLTVMIPYRQLVAVIRPRSRF